MEFPSGFIENLLEQFAELIIRIDELETRIERLETIKDLEDNDSVSEADPLRMDDDTIFHLDD